MSATDSAQAGIDRLENWRRELMAEGWDQCATEAGRRWLIGTTPIAILKEVNPYRQPTNPLGDTK